MSAKRYKYKNLRDEGSIDATNFGCRYGCHGTGLMVIKHKETGEEKQMKCPCEQWRNNNSAEPYPPYQTMKGKKQWKILK